MSATDGERVLKAEKGINTYCTQATNAAEKQKARDGWKFTDKDASSMVTFHCCGWAVGPTHQIPIPLGARVKFQG